MKKLLTLLYSMSTFHKVLATVFILVAAQGIYLVYFEVSDELVLKPGLADDPALDAADKGQLLLEDAVMSYMDENDGKAPKELFELIPKYIKIIPVDPVSGEPYIYQIIDGLPNIIIPSKRVHAPVQSAVKPKKLKETQDRVIMPQW